MRTRLVNGLVTSLFEIACFDFAFVIVYNYIMIPVKTIQDLSVEVAESYYPSCNADTKWHASGIIDFQAPFNKFTLGRELPLITEGADEQVGRKRSQDIDRNAAAILLDWNLRRLSQGKAVIDLRLGELLVKLRKRQPQKLGYVRLADYTREEMGIPWRSASLLVNNWTALEKLPLLKQAHRAGLISKSKLRFLLRVATAENEKAWIEKASKVSVRALEDLVKAEEARRNGTLMIVAGPCACKSCGPCACISQTDPDGKCLPVDAGPDGRCVPAAGGCGSAEEDDLAGYLMTLKTTPEKAAIWDYALEHFRGHEGGNFFTEVFIEALLAEFCSALPLPGGNSHINATGRVACSPNTAVAKIHSNNSVLTGSASAPGDSPLPSGRHWRRITGDEDDEVLSVDGKEADEERERWRTLRKDLEDVTQLWEFLSWTPVTVETPHEWDDALEDIRAVANAIKNIVAMRQLVGFYMGRLLRTFENLHLYADMQFASLNHYAVERLGISMRTARNLIKLVRSFLSLPVLEKAFKDGDLTQQRALLLLKVATEKTEAEWLKYGIEVPALDLELEVKRLSRLIEANPNLLDAYRVLPGFSPSKKAETAASSGKDTLKDEVGPSGAVEIISSAPVQMCATEMLPDTADPGAADSSWKMCATDMLPDAEDPGATDSSWKMCATDGDSTGITIDPINLRVRNSISGFASGFSGDSAFGLDKNTATINFFIPDSLIPLWNYAFIRYLEFAAGSGTEPESPSSPDEAQNTTASDHTSTEIPKKASTLPSHSDGSSALLEGFLFSLIYHYLENEHKDLKKKKRRLRHKVIERDGFRCVIPGCSSRSGLDDHHITFRSQGGGDELPNNSSACFEHHRHCIHDNRYITIKGQAPDNLTVEMGVEPGRSPFALFINGRRVDNNTHE
jgi:hypothetical protein